MATLMKPTVVVDVRRHGATSPFLALSPCIVLRTAHVVRVPIFSFFKLLLSFFVVSYFVFGSVVAPVIYVQHAVAQEQNSNDRATLEKQLLEIEGQIGQYESTVSNFKKQGKTLQAEITRLDAKVKKLNLQIKAIEVSIRQLDNNIGENASRVAVTENDLAFTRHALTLALQRMYERESISLFELLLKHPAFSDFYSTMNALLMLQDELRLVAEKTVMLRDRLVEERDELVLKRTDAASLRAYHDAQKVSLESTKKEQKELLAITKGQEGKYQELLQLSKKTAAQIRAQIFEFLGGGELSFAEAYQYAKVAEAATGVRAALILAVLDRESALGQNVGRCSYKTAMHPRRDIPLFLALTSALVINPDTITVSCANRDGAYGGAMGPAQFIPSTWNLYAARVAEITGNHPASPWRNGDAFVATGLYLRDSGAVKGEALAVERKAAARYYAGSRWQRYLWTYGERVVSRAQQFQNDIEVLNG